MDRDRFIFCSIKNRSVPIDSGTRLLVYAAKLIADGVNPVARSRDIVYSFPAVAVSRTL